MRHSLEAVVIADDLTGAADSGVQLGAIRSPVYLMPVETLSHKRPWMASAASFSVYTATRALSRHAATGRLKLVAQALPTLHPRWVYKKIDSCLRGNLGAEIDVLLDLPGLDAALIAPALPAQGRTTVGGIHRIHGRPLAQSEFAKDPVTPVTRSAVTELLAAQSRHPVGRIDLSEYGSLASLQRAVQRERGRGYRLIVCDALVQAHLEQIAGLVIRSAGRLLPVGSTGLATALVGQLSSSRRSEPPSPRAAPGRPEHPGVDEPGTHRRPMPPIDLPTARRLSSTGHRPNLSGSSGPQPASGYERLLMVCGTASRVTRRQLDLLLGRYPGVRQELDPEWLVAASAAERKRRATELIDTWTGGVLAIGIRPLPPRGPAVDPVQAATGLAGLASAIIEADQTDGLFLSGGETADAFRRMSGGEAIELEQELLPGLVLGRWLGGVADGLIVVTKAGAFGGEQTLVALYERLSVGFSS